MQEKVTCSHAQLEKELRTAAAQSGAAEAHGLLCGIICAGGKASPETWMDYVLGEGDAESAAAWNVKESLQGLQAKSLGQLHDDSFGFTLLLPGDDESLSLRIQAMSGWCSGFLYGLALGGIRDDAILPGDTGEAIKDFYEISNAGFIADPADEDNEASYNDIMEYVRMSVVLIYEELQPVPATQRLQ